MHAGATAIAGGDDDVIAPQPWEETHAGRLIIEFAGGVVAESIARVLDRFANDAAVIPSKQVKFGPEEKDGCAVLNMALGVSAIHCSTDAISALTRFSEAQGTTLRGTELKYRPGVMLAAPDVQAEPYRFKRTFDIGIVNQKETFDALSRNRDWQRIASASYRVPEKGTRIRTLEFTGLRWIVLLKDVAAVSEAEALAFDIGRPHVSVFVERARSKRAVGQRQYADLAPSKFYELCEHGDPNGFKGSYLKYFTPTYNSKAAQQCETPELDQSEVVVIDSPVAPNPDIRLAQGASPSSAALPPASPLSCKTTAQWDRERHHGTYLAGIVASRGQSLGFMGLSQSSVVSNILWGKGAQDLYLTEQIRRLHDQGKPKVFLFAGNFNGVEEALKSSSTLRDNFLSLQKDTIANSLFKDRKYRTQKIAINHVIAHELRPLMVVSAGQPDNLNDPGVVLRPENVQAPQNIGDFMNVIVVTACTDCETNNAKIWEPANRGGPGTDIVYLAAPGGSPIPGLLDERTVGQPAFGGTSAAAAFTAGVAAHMLACYPSYYRKATGLVKQQLLITARQNVNADHRSRAPGGTIDANLAMIHPGKSWLKVAGVDGITELQQFNGWCAGSLTLQSEDGADEAVALRSVRRITSTATPGSYVFRELTQKVEPEQHTVLKLNVAGPGVVSDTGAIADVEMYGDVGRCRLNLSKIDDLILKTEASTPSKVVSCSQLKPCFP